MYKSENNYNEDAPTYKNAQVTEHEFSIEVHRLQTFT